MHTFMYYLHLVPPLHHNGKGSIFYYVHVQGTIKQMRRPHGNETVLASKVHSLQLHLQACSITIHKQKGHVLHSIVHSNQVLDPSVPDANKKLMLVLCSSREPDPRVSEGLVPETIPQHALP